jgi:hypothetical protein
MFEQLFAAVESTYGALAEVDADGGFAHVRAAFTPVQERAAREDRGGRWSRGGVRRPTRSRAT